MSASTEKKLRIAARESGNDRKAQLAAEEAKAKAKSKFKWTLGTVAVVLLVVAAILLNSGLLYTKTTAVKINGVNYSPAEVSYYYGTQYSNFVNTYGDYLAYFGLDTSNGIKGLATQSFSEDQTWKDYLLEQAIAQMSQIQAYSDYATSQGVAVTAEEKAAIDEQIEMVRTSAPQYGYKDLSTFLEYNYGKGVSEAIYREQSQKYALASAGYSAFVESLAYTDEQLADYYASLEGSYDVYSYAVYTVSAVDADEDGTYSEEELAAAEASAKSIVKNYNSDLITTDTTDRLTAAVSKVVEGASATEQNTTGSSLNEAYAEFLKSSPKAGQVKYFANTADSGYLVVAFIGHDDNSYNVGQVRHILVMAEADENGIYTEEALTAAKLEAEKILNEWKSGEATEESFAALADERSADSSEGGLYAEVDKTSYVPEFTAFALGEHEYGDTDIVYGESSSYAGYHVMYYVGQGPLFSNIIAEKLMTNADIEAWSTEVSAPYTAETTGMMRYVG